ncbi:MAG: alpha/beta fold hydrolase [Patescibacteria group bacterium]
MVLLTKRKKLKSNASYFIKKGSVGVLLIHGFTSTASALAGAIDILTENNYTISAPILPGHGTNPDDLLRIKHEDWLEESEKALFELSKHVKKIYIAGFSLGGNIAFYLTAKYPQKVAGIITFGAPIFYRRHMIMRVLLPILRPFKKYAKKRTLENKFLRDYYYKYGSYRVIPLKSMYEMLKLLNLSRKLLRKIKKPILIIQSFFDQTVNSRSAEIIYNAVGTHLNKKELFFIEDKLHVSIYGEHREVIFNEVLNFLKKYSK